MSASISPRLAAPDGTVQAGDVIVRLRTPQLHNSGHEHQNLLACQVVRACYVPERGHGFGDVPDVSLGFVCALCECNIAPRAVNISEQPGSVASSAIQYTRFKNVSSSCAASALSAGHIRSNCKLLTALMLCCAPCVRR